jgi:hypothetical protein
VNDHFVVEVLESRGQFSHHPARNQLRVLCVGRDRVEQVATLDVFSHLERKQNQLKTKFKINLTPNQGNLTQGSITHVNI